MNKIERQILLNQVSIMRFLKFGFPELKTNSIRQQALDINLQKTSDLLNPTKSKEDCCEMGKDANTGKGEKE